jgi:deazaflavin-dependent oxidoreductase (nitroreductase family)
MPLPKGLARFNLAVTNPVLRHVAVRLPGFALVRHVGRRSGKVRTTPVNLFRHGDRYVIALTYGRDSQWVRNVLAAGELDVVTRGRTIRLTRPELVHDPTASLVPAPVRPILRAIGVDDFVVLQRAPVAGVEVA